MLPPVELGSGDIELVGAESKYNRESVFFMLILVLLPAGAPPSCPLPRCYHLQTSRLPEATPSSPCPTLLACAHRRQVVGRPHPRCHRCCHLRCYLRRCSTSSSAAVTVVVAAAVTVAAAVVVAAITVIVQPPPRQRRGVPPGRYGSEPSAAAVVVSPPPPAVVVAVSVATGIRHCRHRF